jgi:hypothetical protein
LAISIVKSGARGGAEGAEQERRRLSPAVIDPVENERVDWDSQDWRWFWLAPKWDWALRVRRETWSVVDNRENLRQRPQRR